MPKGSADNFLLGKLREMTNIEAPSVRDFINFRWLLRF